MSSRFERPLFGGDGTDTGHDRTAVSPSERTSAGPWPGGRSCEHSCHHERLRWAERMDWRAAAAGSRCFARTGVRRRRIATILWKHLLRSVTSLSFVRQAARHANLIPTRRSFRLLWPSADPKRAVTVPSSCQSRCPSRSGQQPCDRRAIGQIGADAERHHDPDDPSRFSVIDGAMTTGSCPAATGWQDLTHSVLFEKEMAARMRRRCRSDTSGRRVRTSMRATRSGRRSVPGS